MTWLAFHAIVQLLVISEITLKFKGTVVSKQRVMHEPAALIPTYLWFPDHLNLGSLKNKVLYRNKWAVISIQKQNN